MNEFEQVFDAAKDNAEVRSALRELSTIAGAHTTLGPSAAVSQEATLKKLG